MQRATRTTHALRIGLGSLALLGALGACAIGGTTGGGPTPTATPIPCATHATATAIVWDEGQQVHGGINGAAPATLSSFTYPLGLPDEGFEGNVTQPGYMAVAPDGHHLAVTENVFVPFAQGSYPYVVDTATHAVTKVTLPGYPIGPDEETRDLAWADNHTLIVFPGIGGRSGTSDTYSYDINTHAATVLPGVTRAIEGEVRCGTLYWLEIGAFAAISPADPDHTQKAPARLHRYDLAGHAEIGSPIALSDATTYGGAEGQIEYAGWDVSRDGARLVYQHMTATVSGGALHISSQFFAANSDGTGAAAILAGPPPVTSTSGAHISISPDGTLVAVTNAQGTPTGATGPISGAGGTKFYSPDAGGQPAWLPDNSGFFATAGASGAIYQYLLATAPVGGRIPGTNVHATGTYPTTLP